MKFRVLKRNGMYYPQYKNSWWPLWLYIEEDFGFGYSTVSFYSATEAIEYCKDLITTESLSKKGAVVWESLDIK